MITVGPLFLTFYSPIKQNRWHWWIIWSDFLILLSSKINWFMNKTLIWNRNWKFSSRKFIKQSLGVAISSRGCNLQRSEKDEIDVDMLPEGIDEKSYHYHMVGQKNSKKWSYKNKHKTTKCSSICYHLTITSELSFIFCSMIQML